MNEEVKEETAKTEDSPEGENELKRMTFGEHLEELRSRLFKCVWMLLFTFSAAMMLYEDLISFITRPHYQAMQLMGRTAEHSKFIAYAYTDPFFAMIKLAFIVGLFIASPWIAYQLWAFIASGLYTKERGMVYWFAFPSFALFLGGCAFGYIYTIPYGLWGLSMMQPQQHIDQVIAFSPYLNLVLLLTIVMGCVFELPLLMLFFSKVGLVQPESYSKWRRFAIVGMFVLSAVLTPPDVFTQLMMVGPLIILYEVGIILAKISVRKQKTESAA